jgi:cyclic beta-1,2-glucan synthetase
MNRVGQAGQGESIWVGWFLATLLPQFAALCAARGDTATAERYRRETDRLARALDEHAWDGAWYRRAYFDDGTPLGSATNDEGRIDAIAQAWAVIAGVGDPARARQAMAAVNEQLVSEADGLIRLLTPPFDTTALDPGYIKGYLPGVRENGGQYTHAAIWVVLAFALLGDGDRAGHLYQLLNPVEHSRTPEAVARYKVEPYVVAADVYGEPPHTGRGGWTWYTGSAGWFYRVGLETLLGLRWAGDSFTIVPCIPHHWREYEIAIDHRRTRYIVTVDNAAGVTGGVARVELDGHSLADGQIRLVDDGLTHQVRVVLGAT